MPGGAFALNEQREQAVDVEVGVAADGAGEVAVVVGGEGVVADDFGGVLGLLHTAEEGVVNGLFERGAASAVEQRLQLGATLGVLQREAESGDELAEKLGLAGIGVPVDATEKRDVLAVQGFGDGDVRGKHELFDDLVTGVVGGDMRTGDAALFVEVDLHLGHVEFEGAAREAPFAEKHGEFEHAFQQVQNRFGDRFRRVVAREGRTHIRARPSTSGRMSS